MMKQFVWMLIFIFCMSFAFSYDPIVFTDSTQITLESCMNSQSSFTLHNPNPTTITIDLSILETKLRDWVSFSQNSVTLDSEESKEIFVYYAIPCREKGIYDLDILLQTQLSESIFKINLQVTHDSNLDVRVSQTTFSGCPCEFETIPFQITNTGSFPETYRVLTNRYEHEVSLPDQIFLAPGQTYDGLVYVQFACNNFGNKNFQLEFLAEGSGYSGSVPISYTINPCYDFTMDVADEISVCQYGAEALDVFFQNDVSTSNILTVQTKNVEFVQPAYAEYVIGENQLIKTQLLLEPLQKTIGNHTLTITAKESIAGLTAQKDVTIEVLECYDVSVQSPANTYNICPKIEYIPITVQNTGIYTENITLTHNLDSENVYFEQSIFTIEPQEIVETFLIVNNTQSMLHSKNKLDVQANIHSALANDSMKITLHSQSSDTCYGVDIQSTIIHANRTVRDYNIYLSQYGLLDDTYSVTLFGEDWMSVQPSQITLRSNETAIATISLSANQTIQNGSYSAILRVENDVYLRDIPVKILLDYKPSYMWLLWLCVILFLVLFLISIMLLLNKKSKGDKQSKIPKKVMTQKKNLLKHNQTQKSKNQKRYILFIFGGLFLIIILFILLLLALLYVPTYFNMQDNLTNETFIEYPIQNETEFISIEEMNDTYSDDEDANTNLPNVIYRIISFISNWFNSLFTPESVDFNESINQTENTTDMNKTSVLGDENADNESITEKEEHKLQDKTEEELIRRQKAEKEVAQKLSEINVTFEDNSLQYMIILENTSREYNLSDFFVDPDGGELRFAINAVDDGVDLQLDNEILTVVPQENFIGVLHTHAYATDNQNATTKSPELTIIVKPKSSQQTSIWFYVLIGIIIIMIFFLILYFDYKIVQSQIIQEKKPKKQSNSKKKSRK